MITKTYIHLLEKQIKEKPEDWLWTHKRWKHRIPNNLEEIKKEHENYFYSRFKQNKK